MPTYTLRNKKTGEAKEVFLSWSKLQEFLQENPDQEHIMSAPSIIAGVDNSSGGRLPDGFKDILKDMKKKHPKSSGLNHLA